eukprot:scaffold37243_cov116-Skeletonema_marinoi.AAC.1
MSGTVSTVAEGNLAAQEGHSINAHNRVYKNGAALSHAEKITIGIEYQKAKAEANGGEPNIVALSRACKVSESTARKIRDEIRDNGRVLSPEEIRNGNKAIVGPGSRALSAVDEAVLYVLYLIDPSRSLSSYRMYLYHLTGTIIDASTIGKWFNHAFPIKGSMRKSCLIPYDKLKPRNILRAIDYIKTIAMMDRSRIKFGDEKHLKGAELYCRKTRRNILTGEVPPILTTPDFRNTYSIIGFCGIDVRTTPVRYGIMEGINDAQSFAMQVQLGVLTGYFQPGDVIVLDRAAIHTGGGNETLEDWLWDNFRIFVLLLPARTPEWNPIELVWNILVQRLRTFSLHLARQFGRHSLVVASQTILNSITHTEVDGCYRKCGY